MGRLKRDLKTPNRPLQQVVKSLCERSQSDVFTTALPEKQVILQKPHDSGPTPPGFQGQQFHCIAFSDVVIETNTADSCLLMKDGNVVIATNILLDFFVFVFISDKDK